MTQVRTGLRVTLSCFLLLGTACSRGTASSSPKFEGSYAVEYDNLKELAAASSAIVLATSETQTTVSNNTQQNGNPDVFDIPDPVNEQVSFEALAGDAGDAKSELQLRRHASEYDLASGGRYILFVKPYKLEGGGTASGLYVSVAGPAAIFSESSGGTWRKISSDMPGVPEQLTIDVVRGLAAVVGTAVDVPPSRVAVGATTVP